MICLFMENEEMNVEQEITKAFDKMEQIAF